MSVGSTSVMLDPGGSSGGFAMAREAGESRLYGGIHYRIDLDAGFAIARNVSARALEVGVPIDRTFVAVGR